MNHQFIINGLVEWIPVGRISSNLRDVLTHRLETYEMVI